MIVMVGNGKWWFFCSIRTVLKSLWFDSDSDLLDLTNFKTLFLYHLYKTINLCLAPLWKEQRISSLYYLPYHRIHQPSLGTSVDYKGMRDRESHLDLNLLFKIQTASIWYYSSRTNFSNWCNSKYIFWYTGTNWT